MRKIEQWMLRAINEAPLIHGQTRVNGNTAVQAHADGVEVRLHGHTIARNKGAGDGWEFNLCGWNTPTTRSRINAIAREFGRPTVVTVRGTPYVSRYVPAGNGIERIEVPTSGWF